MCQFISAICLKNGDLLWNPYTDSHEDLIAIHNLRDNKLGSFARVEFTPKDHEDLDKPDKYILRIDEEREPDWFEDVMKAKTTASLKSIVTRMIVSGPVTCLVGGSHILSQGASVQFTKAVRIVAMLGSSKVGAMWGSSKVGEMLGSSKVGEMRESSNVGAMLESSNVGAMLGSSKVGAMWGSSKVGEMLGSSKVSNDYR